MGGGVLNTRSWYGVDVCEGGGDSDILFVFLGLGWSGGTGQAKEGSL